MSIHKFLFTLARYYRNNKLIRIIAIPFWKKWYAERRKKSIVAFKINGLDALKVIFQNINLNELPIWLEFGTLLGAYRDNDFISYDIDIDLGVFLRDEKKLDIIFKNLGLKLVREFKVNDGKDGIERTYSYKGVFIDIFYFIIDSNYMYTLGFEKTMGKQDNYQLIKYTFNNKGLKRFRFKNVDVLIPQDVENHLKCHYGDNFMIPDPSYSDKNAPNRILLNNKFKISYNEFR